MPFSIYSFQLCLSPDRRGTRNKEVNVFSDGKICQVVDGQVVDGVQVPYNYALSTNLERGLVPAFQHSIGVMFCWCDVPRTYNLRFDFYQKTQLELLFLEPFLWFPPNPSGERASVGPVLY